MRTCVCVDVWNQARRFWVCHECACVCGCSCVRVRVDGCVRVDEWVRVRVRACGRVLRPAPPQPTSATSPWDSTCGEKSGNDERLLCPLCSVLFCLNSSRLRARETNTAVNLLDLRTCSPVLLLSTVLVLLMQDSSRILIVPYPYSYGY